MNNFDFFCPTKIEFGENFIEKIPEYLKSLDIKKPMIVTDKFLAQTPLISKAIKNISGGVLFDDITPNPTNTIVMKMKKVIEDNGVDGLVVIGGGSPIDSAKAAAVVAYTNNDVRDYYDSAKNKLSIEKALPIIALPTTSGTGSEVSKYSVITESQTNLKQSLTSDFIYPKVAIIDPILTVGMPKNVTVSTGLDVLSHALESFASTIENPFTNILALKSVELTFENLNKARLDGNNLEARANMSFAAILAGVAMSHCCGTIGHAIGCQLTSEYDVPHGIACAVIQKKALDYVGDKVGNIKMLVDYLDKSNCDINDAVPTLKRKLEELFTQLETKMDLKDYTMTSEGIHKMAKDAMAHGCMGLNPVEIQIEDVVNLFEELR